jgi:hypothetical protein
MKTIKHFISKILNIGFIEEVENKQRKFGSSDKYFKLTCYQKIGGLKKEIKILLTPDEYLEGVSRADKNKEDFK